MGRPFVSLYTEEQVPVAKHFLRPTRGGTKYSLIEAPFGMIATKDGRRLQRFRSSSTEF